MVCKANLFLNNSDTPQSREQACYAGHFPIQPEATNSAEVIISAEATSSAEAINSAKATIGSACYCQCSRIHGRINNRLSLSLPIQQNTGLSRYTYTFHNASQRRGQEGKSARRGDGLRNYECFPFSQITHFQKVKTIIQKNQTIQFPLTSKSENYNPKKSNHPKFPHFQKVKKS